MNVLFLLTIDILTEGNKTVYEYKLSYVNNTILKWLKHEF